MTIQMVLASFSAAFALLAAGLWVTSTRLTVFYAPPKLGEQRDGTVLSTTKDGRTYDVPAALDRQSKWNKRAALAAACAATFQALSVAPSYDLVTACVR